MFTKYKTLFVSFIIVILCINNVYSQEENEENKQTGNKDVYRKLAFFDLRGTNAIDAAVGTSLINNDYPEPEFGAFFRIGYKHHLTDHLNVNLTFNKYSIVFSDAFNEGYMSFDLNLEYMVSPYSNFSPFVFGGFGYNAANYFETTQTKIQGGIGIEYVVVEGLGVKLMAEYNQAFSNELEGLIVPGKDESFLRVGLGVNIYFGGEKRKEQLLKNIETIINSNLIK